MITQKQFIKNNMRAYSQDLRDKVISKYTNSNLSIMAISKMFNICYETIREWINRYKAHGDYSSKQGVGCGAAYKFTDKEGILKFIASHPDANGIEIRDAVAPHLPMSTFYDTLSRFGITYKKKNQNTKIGAKWLEKNI